MLAAKPQTNMNTSLLSNNTDFPSPYALVRDRMSWRLTFEGRTAGFKHELGAAYVAYLLLRAPREPLHAGALALKVRENSIQPATCLHSVYLAHILWMCCLSRKIPTIAFPCRSPCLFATYH